MKKIAILAFAVAALFGQKGAAPDSRHHSQKAAAPAEKSDAVSSGSDVEHIAEVARQIGLFTMEKDHIEKDEDERLYATIRKATNIKILVENGSNLTKNLKSEFIDFLAKPGALMQVLFATPGSDFYREETEITLGYKPGEDRYKANLAEVAASRGRLESYAGANRDRLDIRYYDAQYRLPIIIVDNQYCYLTIRLSPNEATQSLRMEFNGGFAKSCVAHFDKMWSLSTHEPREGWLSALGLGSWSRSDLVALMACLGTLLGGLSAFFALPAISRRRSESATARTVAVNLPEKPPPPAQSSAQPAKKKRPR